MTRAATTSWRLDTGSVFIETLVAAAIVALILGMTYRVLADTTGRGRMLEARRGALLVAQSKLAAVGSTVPMQAGIQGGVEAPFAWRVAIQPVATGLSVSRAGTLAEVTVAVRRAEGGADLAVLRSRRLVNPR